MLFVAVKLCFAQPSPISFLVHNAGMCVSDTILHVAIRQSVCSLPTLAWLQLLLLQCFSDGGPCNEYKLMKAGECSSCPADCAASHSLSEACLPALVTQTHADKLAASAPSLQQLSDPLQIASMSC